MDLVSFFGLLNIFAGVMLTVGVLLMGTGFVVWVTRLGTYPTYRTEGIKLMEWGVAVLFVLIAMLLIAKFVQVNPGQAMFVVAAAVLALVAWFVITLIQSGSGGEEEEHK